MTETPTARILDGQAVAATIRAEVAQEVSTLVARGLRPPGLTVVFAGDDPASAVYVGSKTKNSAEAGMVGRTVRLPAETTESELIATIDQLNADDAVDGMLVQLPLPGGLSERAILDRIDPDKDVDGFHPVNVGRLWSGQRGFVPATPAGIIQLLRRSDISPAGKHAVIVGRSNIVGKPMAALLLAENATVTICHSRTPDLAAVCRGADILVAAVGKAGLIGPDYVKEGAVVIDVGMNRVTDRAVVEHLFGDNPAKLAGFEKRGSVLTGDVDFGRVAPKAAAITPVPGGVGPLTVAMLLVNTLTAAKRRQGFDA